MSEQLAVNVAHVVHETIDGETILIHLGTGTYYSLDGVGASVWQLLAEGAAPGALTAQLGSRYDAEPTLVQRSVTGFIQELLEEGLLTVSPPGSAPVAVHASGGEGEPSGRAPFVAPVLHKYTDMQEFMLVDPLHDVEAHAGWPHVKAG
jgi:hypothetical protein